jgi:hypothetical protein
MTDTITQISERIAAFLANGQTPSQGGFAAVAEDELEQLHGIIHALIGAKYEVDPDGDLPVEFSLVDRTRFERPMQVAIPYTHKPYQNYGEVELHLLVADRFQNLASYASERAARHLRSATMDLQETAAANRPLSFGGVTYSVAPPSGMTLERAQTTLDDEVRAALRRAPCPEDYTARGQWAEQCAQAAKATLGMNVLARTCRRTPDGITAWFDIPALAKSVKVELPHSA